MGGVKAYASPQKALAKVRFRKWPLLEFTSRFVNEMYDSGFYAIDDDYVFGEQRIVLNRSRGAGSNFFVFIDINRSSVDVFFTDPRPPEAARDLRREDILVCRSFGCGPIASIFGKSPEYASAVAKAAIEAARQKPLNEYRCFLHSHIGSINGKQVWDDGVSEDRDWIAQTMLWHGDYHALTSHNWTHDEEKLGMLSSHCEAGNIVFIPGWENTTTVRDDTLLSPHILVYCDSVETAMEAKKDFLSRKLDEDAQKGNKITPILSGVPRVESSDRLGDEWTKEETAFEQHLAYLKKLHDGGRAALVIAHPMAASPGTDLLDPKSIQLLGAERIRELMFRTVDGIERFNFLEKSRKLDLSKMCDPESRKVIGWLLGEMKRAHIDGGLTPMNVNFLLGRLAEECGMFTTASQDDHYEPPVTSGAIGDYCKGFTRYVVSDSRFGVLMASGRKPTAAEVVYDMINNRSAFRAVAYVSHSSAGIEVVKERMSTALESIWRWFSFAPKYYLNIAQRQLRYILSDQSQKNEMAKELAKAKAFRERPS